MIKTIKCHCARCPFRILAIFLLLLSSQGILFAQQNKVIKGTVYEEGSSQPLVGVTVSIKGKKVTTVSGKEGTYSILAGSQDILVFSYLGLKTREIAVSDKQFINVTLEKSITSLDDVVVVGYGSVKKSDLTGSVSQVKMGDLVKAPISSFTEGLAGRVSGVRVSSSDGQPGVTQDIVIRGVSSLTQSTAPLYVIDGFPVENPASAAINPSDIESINILKDASATAIYGARGANGVIVIETKRGKVSKPVISFNSSYGIQKLLKKIPMMGAYDFVKYQDELNIVRGQANLTAQNYYINGQTLDSYKNIQGIDWQDLVFRTGKIKINDFSIRGGNAQTKYSVSGSIYNQDGIMLNTGYDRFQGRVAIDQVVNSKVKAGVTVNYGSIIPNGVPVANGSSTPVSYLLYQTMVYRPVTGTPGFDLTDQLVDAETITVNDTRFNPVSTILNQYTKNVTGDLLGQAYLTFDITSKLVLRLSGTGSLRSSRLENFYNSKTSQGSSLNPLNLKGVNGSILTTDVSTWSNENTLTYKNEFNKIHSVNAVGGFSTQGVKTRTNGFAAQNIPNEQLGISGLDEGLPYQGYASLSNNTLVSFFGRVNYSFDSRFFLTGTFRGDGTSKFAPGKRWGYFPSGAFAWNMSREKFMQKWQFISNAKLRVSYGITGNNRVPDFPYLASLSLPIGASYSFNNATPSPGIIPSTLANDDLKWESTQQVDIGYDLGLFNNRLELSFDYYRKTTKDLLLNASLPPTAGFPTVFKNIGTLQNEGFEFSLNTINIKSRTFSWTSNFNISFNTNKVVALAQNQEALFAGSFIATNPWISQLGQPAGMFYGYAFNGIYQYADFDNPSPGLYILKKGVPDNGNTRSSIQPGDIKYKDINGDGTINAFDQVITGRSQPIHTGGFSNNFTYKGFDLNIFCQWSYGNQILNADRFTFEGNGNRLANMNQYASYADRWSPTNPSNTLFRAGGQGLLAAFSSRIVEDGSYLRLKTVSLGYNLPGSFLKKLNVTQLRFHVTAQNLLTWTNYSGRDPEVSVRNTALTPGLDYVAYPQARTITFGLNATF